jgi:general secretion pathway protein H
MARRRERGVTLVEVLITVALIAVFTGLAILSTGVADSARLRRSAVMIASAVRVAYGHANAIGRPVRLVLDFEQRTVSLEEASGTLKLEKNDLAGGAAAVTEAEKKAQEEAEQILKGPRAPRSSFKPTKAFGFNPDKDKPGKELESNIRFLQVETGHQDEAVNQGRAYLYFWPGGQAERAAIQLRISTSDADQDVMTLITSPLTGKTEIKKGKLSMPRPRDDAEESERQDTGF